MAAIRHAGRELLRRLPAASLLRAAVDGQRQALRSLQQYPRGLHRPGAARATFSTASTQVDIAASELNGCSKESEEEKKNRRRKAAMMLMKAHCTDDRESEMRSINELFSLLDPANEYSHNELTELQERRSLFEKKKNALLIALLSGDAEQEKEKMAELVAAGRLLRDAVSGQYQLHGQRRDAPKLEEDVADIKRHLKKMMEGKGKSVFEEPGAADSRALLARVLADNGIILEKKMMEGKGKSVFEEPGAADSRALLARVLADNGIILETLDTLKRTVVDNKVMLESFAEELKELKESFDNLDSSVDRLDDTVRERFEEMGERIGSVKEGMEESVKESVDESMREALGSMEEAVKETIEETLEETLEENVIEKLKESMQSMKETIESVETSMGTVEESMERLEETISDALDHKYNSVDSMVEDSKKILEKLEERLDQKNIT